MSSETWLVLGGTGFIGAAVVARLRQEGCRVIAASRTSPELLLDVADEQALHRAMREHQPTGVIVASGKLVGPEDELRSANVSPIRALLALEGFEIVAIGSAAEYGEVSQLPVTEEHPCAPVNDYGRSKWEATQLLLDSGRPVTVVRPSNVVGRGMPRTSLLAQVSYLLLGAHTFEVNRLDFVRDFVAVKDVAEAIVRLRLARAGIVHVGRGQPTNLNDIQTLLARRGIEVTFTERPAERQVPEGKAFVPSIEKLKRIAHFTPQTPLEEALWPSD